MAKEYKKFTEEEIQKFMKKHRLKECFECAGFLFRVKAHADSHGKKENEAVATHAKAVNGKSKPEKTNNP